MRALLPDRAEQEPDKPTETTRSDDEKRPIPRRLDENGRGGALPHDPFDLDTLGVDAVKRLREDSLCALLERQIPDVVSLAVRRHMREGPREDGTDPRTA